MIRTTTRLTRKQYEGGIVCIKKFIKKTYRNNGSSEINSITRTTKIKSKSGGQNESYANVAWMCVCL